MQQPELIAAVQPSIEFSVCGAPLPQGSKVALVSGRRVRRGKDVWVKNPIASIVDQSDRKTKTQPRNRLKHWRQRIAAEAYREFANGLIGPINPWRGAIMLECEFVIPRIDGHYTPVGRKLKKSAPTVPRGDLDKLIRAVGDALSKVVYWDDVQIVGFGSSTKRFATSLAAIGGVHVKVTKL